MSNIFTGFAVTPNSPAISLKVITPSNAQLYGCTGLIITAPGTVVFRAAGDTVDQTISGVTAYSKIFENVLISHVKTGTTASIVGLFAYLPDEPVAPAGMQFVTFNNNGVTEYVMTNDGGDYVTVPA